MYFSNNWLYCFLFVGFSQVRKTPHFSVEYCRNSLMKYMDACFSRVRTISAKMRWNFECFMLNEPLIELIKYCDNKQQFLSPVVLLIWFREPYAFTVLFVYRIRESSWRNKRKKLTGVFCRLTLQRAEVSTDYTWPSRFNPYIFNFCHSDTVALSCARVPEY